MAQQCLKCCPKKKPALWSQPKIHSHPLLKHQNWLGLGKPEARSCELNVGLLHRYNGLSTWAVTCCLPWYTLAANWNQKQTGNLNTSIPVYVVWLWPATILAIVPNTCCWRTFLFLLLCGLTVWCSSWSIETSQGSWPPCWCSQMLSDQEQLLCVLSQKLCLLGLSSHGPGHQCSFLLSLFLIWLPFHPSTRFCS